MENDETHVNTRHKRLLEQIREDHVDDRDARLNGDSDAEIQDSERRDRRAKGQDRGNSREAGRNPERTNSQERVGRGSDSGDGQVDAEGQYAAQGNGPVDGTFAGSVEISPSARELDEHESAVDRSLREKELGIQRQARHRENKKNQLAQELASKGITLQEPPKKAEKPPEKSLTAEESKEDHDKLLYLYIHGSSLLDDVLEIIVRDHEPCQIWALSPEEAELFVDIQLERARKSPKEAKVVRKLVALYDRLVLLMLVGPRLKATGDYIKVHGGLSFR